MVGTYRFVRDALVVSSVAEDMTWMRFDAIDTETYADEYEQLIGMWYEEGRPNEILEFRPDGVAVADEQELKVYVIDSGQLMVVNDSGRTEEGYFRISGNRMTVSSRNDTNVYIRMDPDATLSLGTMEGVWFANDGTLMVVAADGSYEYSGYTSGEGAFAIGGFNRLVMTEEGDPVDYVVQLSEDEATVGFLSVDENGAPWSDEPDFTMHRLEAANINDQFAERFLREFDYIVGFDLEVFPENVAIGFDDNNMSFVASAQLASDPVVTDALNGLWGEFRIELPPTEKVLLHPDDAVTGQPWAILVHDELGFRLTIDRNGEVLSRDINDDSWLQAGM